MGSVGTDVTPPPHPPHAAEAQTYLVSFPLKATTIHCPVEGCQGRAVDRPNLWIYFAHRHV